MVGFGIAPRNCCIAETLRGIDLDTAVGFDCSIAAGLVDIGDNLVGSSVDIAVGIAVAVAAAVVGIVVGIAAVVVCIDGSKY